MRINRFVTALSAAAAALFIGVGTARAAAPLATEPTSLSWLADLLDTAIDGGGGNVQIETVATVNGQSIELPEEFRRQILSFVSSSLRNGNVGAGTSVSVVALDEAGNVIYSSGDVPDNLDELIDLISNR